MVFPRGDPQHVLKFLSKRSIIEYWLLIGFDQWPMAPRRTHTLNLCCTSSGQWPNGYVRKIISSSKYIGIEKPPVGLSYPCKLLLWIYYSMLDLCYPHRVRLFPTDSSPSPSYAYIIKYIYMKLISNSFHTSAEQSSKHRYYKHTKPNHVVAFPICSTCSFT